MLAGQYDLLSRSMTIDLDTDISSLLLGYLRSTETVVDLWLAAAIAHGLVLLSVLLSGHVHAC